MVFERATDYEAREREESERRQTETEEKEGKIEGGVEKREEKVSLTSYEIAAPAVVCGQLLFMKSNPVC